MSVEGIIADQNLAIDAIVNDYVRALEQIISSASASLYQELQNSLLVSPGGDIEQTPANVKVLRSIEKRFNQLLEEYGLSRLNERYAESFNGQFVWFDKVLAAINADLVRPFNAPKFTKADLAEFRAYQLNSEELLNSVVSKIAGRAKTVALLKAGGLPVKALKKELQNTIGVAAGEAASIAETSISTFYRTISDRGFELIQEELPDFDLRYTYEGPLDKLNRPFCAKLERQSRNGKVWTKKQIKAMNNGQLPNVEVTCGGFRCRHQWVLSSKDLNKRDSERPESKRKPKTTAEDRVNLQREFSARRIAQAKVLNASQQPANAQAEAKRVRADAREKIRNGRKR